jgi:glycosyltransferase involved in cell wall biosynthesis
VAERLVAGSVGQSDIDNLVQTVPCGLSFRPEDTEHSRKRGGGLIAIPRCASNAKRGRCYAKVEFMACGRPVILGVNCQAREILEKAQGGICVESENATALTAAIANLY